MIVKYSSLNRLEKPKFTLCSPGSIYNNGLLSNIVGMLVDTEAEEIVFNFNATSELNLRVNRIRRDSVEDDAYVSHIYKSIQNRRLLFVDDIGYFMITNVGDGFDGKIHYKDITAKSVDIEIAQKMVPYIEDGTYKFTNDETGTNKGILETIVETLPLWTIGYVDDAVAAKWRTFEDVDTSLNCLSFLLDNVQNAYECIIIFDCINRTIDVYAQDNYVRQTSIHITKEDFVNSLDITENADDLYTAISVLGDENTTISAINPLGTNVIYNFDYYLSWMSDSLSSKVAAWQDAIAEQTEDYYQLNLQYYEQLEIASNLHLEFEKLAAQLKIYNRCRDNIIAKSDTAFVGDYNNVIIENGGTAITVCEEIADTINCIDALIDECKMQQNNVSSELNEVNVCLEEYKANITNIQKSLSITDYFTEEEYTELCHYIFEGSYTDEYVTITDIMTYEEKFNQMKTLYDRAHYQLLRISKPTQEFNVDVENFIFIKDFEKWSEQLETGCLINVELNMNDIAPLFLCTITINYDDHSLNMTFGNRFNKFDTKSLFDDVLGKITKSANTLSYVKQLLYPIKSGEFNHMQEALQTSRDLTMGAALASTNEEIVIDGLGYTGRRLLENGEYDPKQIKIVSNSIVFTNNDWESCELAVGEIILDNQETVYGINADAMMGRIILGENLHILNESNNLSFDNNGLEITNGINAFKVNPNTSTLLSVSKGNENLLFVNDQGNLYVKGAINATSGAIGAWNILNAGYLGSASYNDIDSKYYGIGLDPRNTAFESNSVVLAIGQLGDGNAASPDDAISGDWDNATFRVKADGSFYATNAEITGRIIATSGSFTGTVTANSGSIAGWGITTNYFGKTQQLKYYDDKDTLYTYGAGLSANYAGTKSTCLAIGFMPEGISGPWDNAEFRVTGDGKLYATNATIQGNITATSGSFTGTVNASAGTIGGWNITEAALQSASNATTGAQVGMSATQSDWAFWAGYDKSQSTTSAPFRVKSDGSLYATNATIQGNITATSGSFTGTVNANSGSIAGWTIDQNYIRAGGDNTNKVGMSATQSDWAFWAGYNGTTAQFQVKSDGTLIAKKGTFSGQLSGNSGKIGGWTISDTSLSGTSAAGDIVIKPYSVKCGTQEVTWARIIRTILSIQDPG